MRRSEAESNKIYIFDGQGKSTPMHILEKLHSQPVVCMKVSKGTFVCFKLTLTMVYDSNHGCYLFQYNAAFSVVVSADKTGIMEYWTGPKTDYKFPKTVKFESKLDTDLFDFVKNKTYPLSIAFPPQGHKMAVLSADRKVFILSAYP